MKKPILILLVLCSIIVGCKKKQADSTEVTIIGKWYLKTLINTGGVNQGTFTGFNEQDYYIFGADNNVTMSNSGQSITAMMRYTYTKEATNDKIVLSNADRADTYFVLKLTTDSLVMRSSLSTVNGQPLISTSNATYKFARK